jgi:predicted DNA-binding transcriptional regulator AlpA
MMVERRVRHNHLPANLPPRGLSREESASYVGVGPTKFDDMVRDGRMPKPFHVDNRVLWDRWKLDRSIDLLGARDDDDNNPWDDAVK